MNTEKKEIKKSARRLGLFMLGHQLFFQVGSIVLSLILFSILFLLRMEHLEDSLLYISSDLMQLVAGVLFFLTFYVVNRPRIKSIPMVKKKCTSKLFGKCLITIFVVNMVLSLIEMLLVTFTGFSLTVPMDGASNMNPVLMFVTVAVFPAIVEELLYRGILYRYLRVHGVQFASITSSIIFGLIHLNFLQFVFATLMGIVCCYIYEATGKIRYSMLLHLLNNSILVVFSILPISEISSAIIQIVLGVVSLVVAVTYLIYRKKTHGELKTDMGIEIKKNCLYFFTSVPMIIFVVACLGVCAYVSFT